MTYNAREDHAYLGDPVELLLISTKDQSFFYTNSDSEYEYNGDLYLPVPFSSPEITVTGDVSKATLTFKMSLFDQDGLRLPIPRLNIPHPYPSRVGVAVYRTHRSDPDQEVRPIWNGLLKGATIANNEAEIACETLLSLMSRRGLSDKWQLPCNFFLYKQNGGRCPVDKEAHRRPATVTTISKNLITVTGLGAFADDWFKAGMAEASDGDVRDVLASDQSSGVITLTAAFPSTTIQVGSSIDIFDGCQHRYNEDCVVKFGSETNNGEAFGGFPFTPKDNAFVSGLR